MKVEVNRFIIPIHLIILHNVVMGVAEQMQAVELLNVGQIVGQIAEAAAAIEHND